MRNKLPSTISLEDAYFCLNCEVITNWAATCPLCGHKHLWALAQWIGRVDKENSKYRTSPLN